jgi:hypothetical protein
MATASAAREAAQTAAAVRPVLAVVEKVVLSMPLLKRMCAALTNE